MEDRKARRSLVHRPAALNSRPGTPMQQSIEVHVATKTANCTAENRLALPAIRDGYRRHYAHWHNDSEAHFEEMVCSYERKLSSLLADAGCVNILEIGCGPGFCLGALQRLGISAFEGIDSDAGQVAVARARSLPARHIPVPQFAAYATERPGTFDRVLMFDVLEHVPDQDRLSFLRDVLLVLKSGGVLICQVPNANSIVASRYRYIDATHRTSFTETSLDFELYRAGFDDIAIMEADPIVRPSLRYPRGVVRWALRRALRHAVRRCYEFEIGGDAWTMPLSPNLLATASRG
jgi:SAM-dependent methyltransferase